MMGRTHKPLASIMTLSDNIVGTQHSLLPPCLSCHSHSVVHPTAATAWVCPIPQDLYFIMNDLMTIEMRDDEKVLMRVRAITQCGGNFPAVSTMRQMLTSVQGRVGESVAGQEDPSRVH